MTTIVTRQGKGAPLTNAEVDANFTNLNSDKLEKTNNLSELSNASAARGNLGLGAMATLSSVTLTGDATGSGSSSISVTLANSGVTAGAYGSSTSVPVVTVDAKGRVTGVTTAAISGSLTFTGDVTGTGSTGASTSLTLANSGVTAGTYANATVTVDAKGRITSASSGASGVSSFNTRTGTITLTSGDVTTALGFTPFSSAGGTVSGDLTMASGKNIVLGRTSENARDTGIKLPSGQDLGEMDRSNQYYDDLTANCSGYLPTGNCSGNAYWTPPNGNWWTWGVSGVPTTNCANYGAYDGGGGFTQSFNAVSVGTYYDAYYLAADEIGGGEYRRNYRNCNCGSFNCRTNCNCNCACVCQCCGCC